MMMLQLIFSVAGVLTVRAAADAAVDITQMKALGGDKCTAIAVGRKATADDSTMTTHTGMFSVLSAFFYICALTIALTIVQTIVQLTVRNVTGVLARSQPETGQRVPFDLSICLLQSFLALLEATEELPGRKRYC